MMSAKIVMNHDTDAFTITSLGLEYFQTAVLISSAKAAISPASKCLQVVRNKKARCSGINHASPSIS